MKVGVPTSGKKGRVAVKTTKTSGYRSEGCDIYQATLQNASAKLAVSETGSGRCAGKMGTYEVGAQSEGGEFLVCLRDAHIYPAYR